MWVVTLETVIVRIRKCITFTILYLKFASIAHNEFFAIDIELH